MTPQEFDQIREELGMKCDEILATKGTEYTRGEDDRLSNFKRLAAELDIPPEKVLWVFLKKHLDTLNYAVCHNFDVESERFESRIVDARNYLDLLYGIFVEHLQVKGADKLPPLKKLDKFNLGGTHSPPVRLATPPDNEVDLPF